MKVSVFDLQGKEVKKVELPKVFSTPLNRELIKRAVLSIQSNNYQPNGTNPRAGRETSAEYKGLRSLPNANRSINTGRARRPRTKENRHLLQGRVAGIASAVGGARAHPPKAEKVIAEKINKKEKKKALESAIGSSTVFELVSKRHVVDDKMQLPLIIEENFCDLDKTSKVIEVLTKLGLDKDLENAKNKKRSKPGKAKRRGRKFKQKKSLLIVTSKNASVYKAARNLPGVDIVSVDSLNTELLAPGTEPGRLTLWTEKAVEQLN